MYFSVTRSAISIPPWINPLYNLIDEHIRVIEEFKDTFGDIGVEKIYEKYFSNYTKEEFEQELHGKCTYVHPDDIERAAKIMADSRETGKKTVVDIEKLREAYDRMEALRF